MTDAVGTSVSATGRGSPGDGGKTVGFTSVLSGSCRSVVGSSSGGRGGAVSDQVSAQCYGSYHQPQSGNALSQQSGFSDCADVMTSAEKDEGKHFPRHNHGFCVLLTACDGAKHGRMPVPRR